ncbi:hypothetical protein IRJ41_011980 [Triplophysa rosa]|uniref:Uncharacterized protein n=1 Tax=Triplophysa rosa TaxID=992332 RepID=A0A9W7WCR6_TRIRA|nr:hypothetical protein IRJ41_011980 [Triplophysa rosa]
MEFLGNEGTFTPQGGMPAHSVGEDAKHESSFLLPLSAERETAIPTGLLWLCMDVRPLERLSSYCKHDSTPPPFQPHHASGAQLGEEEREAEKETHRDDREEEIHRNQNSLKAVDIHPSILGLNL